MGFIWDRQVQQVLSRISLGLSGLSISGYPLMGLSLNPLISLSMCFRRKEKERTRKSDRIVRRKWGKKCMEKPRKKGKGGEEKNNNKYN
jgi:hypothetical protein